MNFTKSIQTMLTLNVADIPLPGPSETGAEHLRSTDFRKFFTQLNEHLFSGLIVQSLTLESEVHKQIHFGGKARECVFRVVTSSSVYFDR